METKLETNSFPAFSTPHLRLKVVPGGNEARFDIGNQEGRVFCSWLPWTHSERRSRDPTRIPQMSYSLALCASNLAISPRIVGKESLTHSYTARDAVWGSEGLQIELACAGNERYN